jgi:hypothetical protein
MESKPEITAEAIRDAGHFFRSFGEGRHEAVAAHVLNTVAANFHLVEAAPALLAALETLFADYKQLADSGDAGNWALEDTDAGKTAIAAIAKARGEA